MESVADSTLTKSVGSAVPEASFRNQLHRQTARLGIRILLLLCIVAPAVGSLEFIREFAVNVPFWDQWVVIPYFERYFSGTLTIADLFAQHNEHRMFFPRIVMLALAIVTHYNTIAEMYTTWVLLCINALVLYKGLPFAERSILRYVAFLPVCYAAFNLRWYETLLFGIEVQWALGILATWLCLTTLERSTSNWRGLGLALLSGVVASYSFADGLLVWPIGCLQIFLAGKLLRAPKGEIVQKLVAWGMAGLVVMALYFHGYSKPANSPSLLDALKDPATTVMYFLAALGTSLAPSLPMALVTGSLILFGICSVIVAHVRGEISSRSVIPISMISFALGSAALLAFGRVGFGLGQSLTPRYALLTIYAVIGVYEVAVSAHFRQESFRHFLLGAVISLLVLGLSISAWDSIGAGNSWRTDRLSLAYIVRNYRLESNKQLSRLFPEPSTVRTGAQFLASHHLSVFSSDDVPALSNLPRLNGRTDFSIDTINGNPVANHPIKLEVNQGKEDSIIVTGYAVDRNAQKPARAVFMRIDGEFVVPAMYGVAREDVALSFHIPSYRATGFWCAFATDLLSPGAHRMVIDIVAADSKGYYEGSQNFTLDIR